MTRIAGAAMLAAILIAIIAATAHALGWRQALAAWTLAALVTGWVVLAAHLLTGGTW